MPSAPSTVVPKTFTKLCLAAGRAAMLTKVREACGSLGDVGVAAAQKLDDNGIAAVLWGLRVWAVAEAKASKAGA